MKLLIYIHYLKEIFMGRELQKTLARNAEAADQLDRAVKEMLKK
ncbi:MAG: hypothetical protein AAFW64_10020 [Pseudomonadota bacterium]